MRTLADGHLHRREAASAAIASAWTPFPRGIETTA
jgi:hypothetical protein